MQVFCRERVCLTRESHLGFGKQGRLTPCPNFKAEGEKGVGVKLW